MSSLDSTGLPLVPIRRREGRPIRQIGLVDELLASGIVAESPSRTSSMTDQLASAIGATSLLAGAVLTESAKDRERRESEIRAAARVAEKQAAEEAAASRGLAARDTAAALPRVVSDLNDGKYDDELAKLGSGDFARRFSLDFGGDDFGPAYSEEALDRMLPVLSAAAQRRMDSVVAGARAEAVGAIVQSVPGADDPAALGDALARIRTVDPAMTESAAASAIGKAALDHAVVTAASDPDSASKMLDAATAFLGDRMRTEQAIARERVGVAIDKWEQDRTAAAVDGVYRQLNDPKTPLEAVRESVRDDARLSESQRAQFYNTIDIRARQRAGEVQQASTNSLVRDVGLRRWFEDDAGTPSPVATAEAIVRRMDITDANDPLFIDADRGLALINTVRGAVDFDTRADRIGESMRDLLASESEGGRRYITPATSADDAAIVRTFADAGILSAVDQGGGSFALRGVADPVRFAFFAKGINRVPIHVQEAIRAGLTGDQQQIAEAASVYGALYLQAPDLARSIDLPPEAALRARYVASRLERMGPGAVADAASIRNAVGNLSSVAVKLDPTIAAYKPDEVLGLAYFKDAGAAAAKRSTFTSEVRTKAEADIRSGVFDSEAFTDATITPSRYMGLAGNARLDNIPAPVLDSFLGYLSEEFRYAKSLTPSEELAAKGAKAWALDRALADHPPYAWNGTVYFGQKGDPQLPQDAILDDLATPPDDPRVDPEGFARMARERADDLVNNYVPVWDARQHGYVFRSLADPFELFTTWTADSVGPLVVNPMERVAGGEDMTAKIDTTLNQQREKRRRSVRPGVTRPDPMDLFTRRRFGGLE